MANTPHYFIAVHLPENLQDYFSKWQESLHDKLPYKQWYNKKDLHITLKFLGAVEDEKLVALDKALKPIDKCTAFDVQVGSIGTFGNSKKPRVLWVGVEKKQSILNLQKVVEEAAAQVGFSKENREYRPHITLAKRWIGESNYSNDLETIKSQFADMKTMHVGEVIVFQIHPGCKQKYEAVKRYSLR